MSDELRHRTTVNLLPKLENHERRRDGRDDPASDRPGGERFPKGKFCAASVSTHHGGFDVLEDTEVKRPNSTRGE